MAEITYTFRGMNNVDDPADVGAPDPKKRDLVFTEVLDLVNVDTSNTDCISLRPGRIPAALGAGYHSGWSNPYNPSEGYIVRSGSLWRIDIDTPVQNFHYAGSGDIAPTTPSFTLVRSGLSDLPMSFVQVNEAVRYSNGVQCGVIEYGVDTAPFVPTALYKHPMVAGKFEEIYNGRLYALVDSPPGVVGSVLYCSDPMDVPGWIESMDERHNIVMVLKGAARGLCRVDDGLFVSAGEETFFLDGDDAVTGLTNAYKHEGFIEKSVAPYAMIPGTVRPIRAELLGVEGVKGWACIWASTRGVCVGGNGGFFQNLTEGKVSYPPGVTGTALVREQLGATHYLFILQAPTASGYNQFLPRPVDVGSSDIL